MSWKTVLEQFQTRDPTMDQHEEMRQRAGNWFCCAVGERLKLPRPDIETVGEGEAQVAYAESLKILAPEVMSAGSWFSLHINQMEFAAAQETEAKIGRLLTPELIERIRREYVRRRQDSRRRRIYHDQNSMFGMDGNKTECGVNA